MQNAASGVIHAFALRVWSSDNSLFGSGFHGNFSSGFESGCSIGFGSSFSSSSFGFRLCGWRWFGFGSGLGR